MDISIIDKRNHIRIAWIKVCPQCIDHGTCMRASVTESVQHFSSRYSVRIAHWLANARSFFLRVQIFSNIPWLDISFGKLECAHSIPSRRWNIIVRCRR